MGDYTEECRVIFVAAATLNPILKLRGLRHFELGGRHSASDFRFVVCPTSSDTRLELIGRDFDKHSDESVRQQGILRSRGAKASDALHIDIGHEILPVRERLNDRRGERSIAAVAMHPSPFQKLARALLRLEDFGAEKMVMHAIDFARARGTGGRRDDTREAVLRVLHEAFAQCAFARSGGPRENQKERRSSVFFGGSGSGNGGSSNVSHGAKENDRKFAGTIGASGATGRDKRERVMSFVYRRPQ